MKDKIINFLHDAFPFLLVLGLWRLSGKFLNPGGILALIPIFYFTFIRHVHGFGLFGALFCFLIDYKFNTLCMWLALFCLFYAINGFQSIIDITRMERNARDAFLVFIGAGICLLVITNFTFSNLGTGLWIFIWSGFIYFPITEFIKKVQND